MIVPWHNEWLSIWLYLGFAVYFWVEAISLLAEDSHQYKFINLKDFEYMFVATLGIAISLTTTCIYLVFYSGSEIINLLLDEFDYVGKLVGIFFFTFAFIASEFNSSAAQFWMILLIYFVLGANLVMI